MSVAHWDGPKKNRRDNGHLRGLWTDLGTAAGSVDVGVKRIELEEGDISTPVHVHQDEEEIFFVVGGTGLSWQGGKTYEVRAGDTIVHRVYGAPHTLRAGAGGLDVLAFGQRALGQGGYLPRAGIIWAWPTWVETGHGEPPWDREAAAGPPEFPAPEAERPPGVRALEDCELTDRAGRARTRACAPAPLTEFTGLNWNELEPGQTGAALHCHSAEEELFVVLDGDGTLLLGDEQQAVRRGTVVSRPPATRVPHELTAGPGGLTYLAYGTREPNDIVFYPRENKIAFRGVGVVADVSALNPER